MAVSERLGEDQRAPFKPSRSSKAVVNVVAPSSA